MVHGCLPACFAADLLAADLARICFRVVSWVPKNGFIPTGKLRIIRKAAGEGSALPDACLAPDGGSTVIGCHVRPRRQGGKKNEINPPRSAQVGVRRVGRDPAWQT